MDSPLELLQEVLIGFCSDGASVMLGTKSGVGKLLKDEFPNIVLWHCLNHRLELAVGNALDATSGTNDLQSFLVYIILYSQSSKNMRETIVAAVLQYSLTDQRRCNLISVATLLLGKSTGFHNKKH